MNGSIYQQSGRQWLSHQPIPRAKGLPTFEKQGTPCLPPSFPLQCASVFIDQNLLHCSGYTPFISMQTLPANFQIHLESLPSSATWCLNKLIIPTNGRDKAEVICNRSARAISDGSFNLLHGTASWIIVGDDDQYVTGCTVIPENSNDHSA
jgi:hypothetical protein